MVMKKWTSTLSFWSPFKKIGALSHAAIGWNKKNHNVCHFGSGSRSSSRFTLCTWPQVGQILPLHLRCRCPQKKAQNLLPILKSLKKNLVNYTHSFAVPDVPYSSLSGYISPEKKGAAYPTYPNLWGDLTAAHLILIVWRLGVAHFLPRNPHILDLFELRNPKKME